MLITVGAWVLLVIAMVGCVGAMLEVVLGRHAGQDQEALVACREWSKHYPSASLRHC